MKANAELLNFIYQNSQMGVDSVEQLITITEDEDFKKDLEYYLLKYKHINNKATKLLHENGYEEKEISELTKISAYLMINIQTLANKSTSHIAEMLIKGSNMGIIQAIKKLKEYDDCEKDIRALMDKLLAIEENNVRTLKHYL